METINKMNQVVNRDPMNEIVPPMGRPRLTFMQAVGACISNYANFTGRARRSEYWWFWLFTILLLGLPMIALSVVALVFEGTLHVDPEHVSETTQVIDGIILVVQCVICLFLLLPSLAVQTRRLHDVGRSGWWIVGGVFASCIFSIVESCLMAGAVGRGSSIYNIYQTFNVSTVGALVMLLFYLLQVGLGIAVFIFSLIDSYRGENLYGTSPKYQ